MTSLWSPLKVSGKRTISGLSIYLRQSKFPYMWNWSYCIWTVGFVHAFYFFQLCPLCTADFNITSWISLYDVISENNFIKDKLSDLKALFCSNVLSTYPRAFIFLINVWFTAAARVKIGYSRRQEKEGNF